MVRIGRISTGLIMLLAMLWSTQGDQFGTIFEAINKIPMPFAPAATTVFVLGILWPRGTVEAAIATLYAGSLIGIVYFLLPARGRPVDPAIRGSRRLQRADHGSRAGMGHSIHAGGPVAHCRVREHLHRREPEHSSYGPGCRPGGLLGSSVRLF